MSKLVAAVGEWRQLGQMLPQMQRKDVVNTFPRAGCLISLHVMID